MTGILGRTCYTPRCPNVVTRKGRKFCDAHHVEERNEARTTWKKKEKNKFYDSKEWRRLRAYKIAMKPVCEHCKRREASEVDHIEPLSIAPERALDIENLQSLCRSCHARKSQKESRDVIRRRSL